MQGKEASEQETGVQFSVGVDVSKAWLDVHLLPLGERLRVANSASGIRRLKTRLKRLGGRLLVALEATGKWHRPLWRSLHAAGIPVAVLDGYRVRAFAKAQGVLAKTDRLDAELLARFAALMAPPGRSPAPEAQEEIAELVRARERAVAEQTGLKNQLAAATTTFLRRQLARRIQALCRTLKALEREILARIEADPALARRYLLLTSIPGIGFVAAATLITQLAELGSLSDKQIGMLAGLAPVADQSGQRIGRRVIWGGRAKVRRALYLAALSATRCNAAMGGFYQRLRQAGKPPKSAIIAVARKLVILANVLISQNRPWLPTAPKHA